MPNLSTLSLPSGPSIPVNGVDLKRPLQSAAKALTLSPTGRVNLSDAAKAQSQAEIEKKQSDAIKFTVSELGQQLKAERPDLFGAYSDEEVGNKMLERKPELAQHVVEPEKKGNFIVSLLKDIAKPYVRDAALVAGAVRPWVGHGTADNPNTDKYGLNAEGNWEGTKIQDNTVDVPLYGKVKPTGEALARGDVKNGLADIAGNALEIASFGMMGGGTGTLAKGAAKAGLKEFAKEGAILGGMNNLGRSWQEKGFDLGKNATDLGTGSVFGGALGAAVPVIGSVFSKTVKINPQTLETTGRWSKSFEVPKAPPRPSGARLLPKTSTEIKNLAEKSGIEKKLIDLVDTGSVDDAKAMVKMMDNAESASKSYLAGQPSDVAAETVLSRVSHLQNAEETVGKKLGTIVRNMPEKPIDVSQPFDNFISGLEGMGIRINDLNQIARELAEGKNPAVLDFSQSSLSGTTSGPTRKMLENAFLDLFNQGKIELLPNRANTLRQALFSDLGLGKAGAILDSRAETLLQGLRRDLMGSLSKVSRSYATESKKYAMIEEALEAFNGLMGKKFVRVDKTTLRRRAGEVASRVLGNASADALRVLGTLEQAATETGFKAGDDMVRQMIFADALTEIFNITKPRSFQGGVEKGVEKALEGAGIAYDIAKGNWMGAGTKLVSKALGRTPEKQREALRELIMYKLRSSVKLKSKILK